VSEAVSAPAVVAWMRVFAEAVAREREYLTELDAAIGDADHGINMERGTQAVVAKLEGFEGGSAAGAAGGLGPLLKTIGMTLVSTVGGAAGPLYGTLFLAMATAAGEATELSLAAWAATLDAGVAGVRARGKAEPGDKTMLDALLPAVEALKAAAASGLSLKAALQGSAAAARQGMTVTVALVARKGRASYLGERSAGHQDPGATSSWLLLQTAAETLAGQEGGERTP
jgi:phosphoenolpyruvate---glycerone phosphotransferase subunit DhaL